MTLANRLLFTALLALFSLLPTAAFCADEEDALEGLEWRPRRPGPRCMLR